MIVSCKSGVVNRIKSIYDFRLTIFDDVRSQGYFFKALDRLCKGLYLFGTEGWDICIIFRQPDSEARAFVLFRFYVYSSSMLRYDFLYD